jgi:hypothetical protein
MAHISTTYVPVEDAPTLRTPIDPPTFRDGDRVMFKRGTTMSGKEGVIIQPRFHDSKPGETVVFVTAWGFPCYAIPESHLIRL